MFDPFNLQRVIWNDGDVLTAEHFHEFELSIDSRIGIGHLLTGLHGLIRDPVRQSRYNQTACILLRYERGATCSVSIESIMGIGKDGRAIKIDERKTFELKFRSANTSDSDEQIIYVVPATPEAAAHVENDEPQSGVLFSVPGYSLSVTDENDNGLPIARLIFSEGVPETDRTFIPYSVFISSSEASLGAWKNIKERLQTFIGLLESYISTLIPSTELIAVWSSSCSLLRLANNIKGATVSKSLSTNNYFCFLAGFFSSLRTDLLALSSLLTEKSGRDKATTLMQELDIDRLVITVEQRDLTAAYGLVQKWMESMTEFLAFLPAGPVVEKTLRIHTAELAIGSGFGNRITVALEEPVTLRRGLSTVSILLRDISRSEPQLNNARIGFDNALFPQLLDMPGILQRQSGDSLTYRIQCPKDIVTKDSVNVLTLYLPQPFGEDIPDLKSRISITILD